MNDKYDSMTRPSPSWNIRSFQSVDSPNGRRPGVREFQTGPAILSKRKTVFIVDDDPGMLRGVKRLLSAHGYDSVLFESADAFQKQVDFERAICLILDINLSDGSGIDLRQRLKS